MTYWMTKAAFALPKARVWPCICFAVVFEVLVKTDAEKEYEIGGVFIYLKRSWKIPAGQKECSLPFQVPDRGIANLIAAVFVIWVHVELGLFAVMNRLCKDLRSEVNLAVVISVLIVFNRRCQASGNEEEEPEHAEQQVCQYISRKS